MVAVEIVLRYTHGLGDLAPYFDGLERGAAVARRCANCGRTWFPPRVVCGCGSADGEWVELAGRGTIVAATRGRATLPGTPVTGELGFALIRLDGADNLAFGRLAGEAARLTPGAAVRLRRADGEWAHPAQCAEYAPDDGARG
jgi:uncharacterized OB-fold protein